MGPLVRVNANFPKKTKTQIWTGFFNELSFCCFSKEEWLVGLVDNLVLPLNAITGPSPVRKSLVSSCILRCIGKGQPLQLIPGSAREVRNLDRHTARFDRSLGQLDQ